MSGIEDSDYTAARRIDLVCDQFEQQLNADGGRGSIEDYLGEVSEDYRDRLLFELLQVEFSSRWEADEPIDRDDYLSRFPDLSQIVRDAYAAFHQEPTHASRLRPGEALGKFHIRGFLGEGAHATVYRAFDGVLQRDVALKVFHKDLPHHLAELFLREARIAAQFTSSGFCQVHETGEADSRQYIAMQLVEGKSLKELMRASVGWKPRAAAELVRKIAAVLEVAHRREIFHRDLKPANILLSTDDNVFIADFGLADRKCIESTQATMPATAGSPAYMAPEQLAQAPDVDPAKVDIFSLGIIFYQLLVGQRPKRDPSGNVCLQGVKLPRTTRRVLGRMLAGDPANRYRTLADLGADLKSLEKGNLLLPLLITCGVIMTVALGSILLRSRTPVALPDEAATHQPRNAQSQTVLAAPPTMHIGAVRKMVGQELPIWLLESTFESIDPKRDMDLSFGPPRATYHRLAGRWDTPTQSLPTAIEELDGHLRWHVGPSDGRHVDFGIKGDLPQAADWTGNGLDETIVIRRGRGQTIDDHDGRWHWLVSSFGGRAPFVDLSFMEIRDGDVPLTGTTTEGRCARPIVARPNRDNRFDWYFYDEGEQPVCSFGDIGGQPIVADFNGDGLADLATVEEGKRELVWSFDFERDGSVDKKHAFGLHGDTPVVGAWHYPKMKVQSDDGLNIYATSVATLSRNQRRKFLISNTGLARLKISGIAVIAGGFAIRKGEQASELAAGETVEFEVEHIGGTADGLVSIISNEPNTSDLRFTLAVSPEEDRHIGQVTTVSDFKQKLIALPDLPHVDGFGNCIAASDDSLVVGAPGRDDGLVCVFDVAREAGKLVPQMLRASEPSLDFGRSLDIHGDTIVVGVPKRIGLGHANVYSRKGRRAWELLTSLQPEQSIGHKFGSAVSIWGDTIAVGSFVETAVVDEDRVPWAGCVHIFQKTEDEWGFVQQVFAPLPREKERFGSSVLVGRESIAVGTSPSKSSPADVFVFHRQKARLSRWAEPTALTIAAVVARQEDLKLCMGGTLLAIGAPGALDKQQLPVFYRQPYVPDDWSPWPVLSPQDDSYDFGNAVEIAPDGLNLVVSARPKSRSLAGKVFLYRRSSLATADWTLICELTPNAKEPSATFGASLAVLGDAVFIGDPVANAVHAFQVAIGGR